MSKVKVDGVVEAVRYAPDGQIAWVRAYLRRGPVFSDRVLVEREDLVASVKSGMKLVSGKRIPDQGGTFELKNPLELVKKDGQEIVIIGNSKSEKDDLQGVPLI